MKKLLLTFVPLLLASTLMAQSIQLVKDLSSGSDDSFGYGDGIKANLGDLVFVSEFNDATSKTELWVSDGTSSGTVVIATSTSQYDRFESFILFDATHLAFILTDNSESVIYLTDGTVGGTTRLDYTDRNSRIYSLTVNNGKLYYSDYSDIREVNTLAGTDEIFFTAESRINDYFWKDANTIYYSWNYNDFDDDANDSDILESYNVSTTTSTEIYRFPTLYQGAMEFKNVNGKVLFYAHYADDKGLWATDGTNAGTIKLTSFATSGLVSEYMYVYNDKLYIDAALSPNDPNQRGYELYVSDGTVSGTYSLYSTTNQINYVDDIQVYNNEIYFSAMDMESGRYEIYHTNGTVNGTVKVTNTHFRSYYALDMKKSSGVLFFLAGSAGTDIGYEIWSYNGTGFQYHETLTGDDDLSPDYLYGTPGKLFLSAVETATGRELYLFTGTVTNVTSSYVLSQELVAYPNPATETITLEHINGAAVEVLSIRSVDGKLFTVERVNDVIALTSLQPGLYFLEVESNGTKAFVKFIKK